MGADSFRASSSAIEVCVDPVSRMKGKGPSPLTRTAITGSLWGPMRNGVTEVGLPTVAAVLLVKPIRRHEQIATRRTNHPLPVLSTVKNAAAARRDGEVRK